MGTHLNPRQAIPQHSDPDLGAPSPESRPPPLIHVSWYQKFLLPSLCLNYGTFLFNLKLKSQVFLVKHILEKVRLLIIACKKFFVKKSTGNPSTESLFLFFQKLIHGFFPSFSLFPASAAIACSSPTCSANVSLGSFLLLIDSQIRDNRPWTISNVRLCSHRRTAALEFGECLYPFHINVARK